MRHLPLQVKGKRLDLSSGVRTRRQTAASGGEQWSHVPVAVRMTAVVAQLLVERPWDTAGGDEEAMDDVFGDDDEDWLEDGEDEEADEHEDDEAIEVRGASGGRAWDVAGMPHGRCLGAVLSLLPRVRHGECRVLISGLSWVGAERAWAGA